AALKGRFTKEGILGILKDPLTVKTEISKIEDEIKSLQPDNAPTLLRKAQQLAEHMNTEKYGANLLGNAYAIAKMFGETRERHADANPHMVELIDHLTSLYA